MSFTVADLVTLKKIGLSVLNASSAYAATSDDDKFSDGEIAELIFQGDERVYVAIAETKGHYARPDIMTWSSDVTTYLDEVPAHLGELGDVQIKYVSSDLVYQLAKPMNRQEIEIYRRDTDSYLNATHAATGTLTAGYYDPEALKDGVCAFTGYALQVRRVASYLRTAALQSPSEYAALILAHFGSVAFTKDGLDPELAKYYSLQANNREALVRGNAKVLTELPEMKRAA